MLTFATVLFVIALIWTAILTSLVRVPTINYGVVLRWGRRTKRVFDEGLHIIIPFGIETVLLVPYDLREISFEDNGSLKTVTEDRVVVEIEGQLQYRPANIKTMDETGDQQLILRFLETTGDKITTGLLGAIKDGLGSVAGVTTSDKFIRDREALGFLIDSLLRLETTPHLNPIPYPDPNHPKHGEVWIADIPTLTIPPGNRRIRIPVDSPEDRLDFYKMNRGTIRDLLKETTSSGSTSSLELRYGIDIMTLTISKVSFSPKVIEAMEKQREERAKQEALVVQVEQVVTGSKRLRDKNGGNLTREQANDVMGVLTGTAKPRNIQEIRGLKGGTLPVIQIGNPPANP